MSQSNKIKYTSFWHALKNLETDIREEYALAMQAVETQLKQSQEQLSLMIGKGHVLQHRQRQLKADLKAAQDALARKKVGLMPYSVMAFNPIDQQTQKTIKALQNTLTETLVQQKKLEEQLQEQKKQVEQKTQEYLQQTKQLEDERDQLHVELKKAQKEQHVPISEYKKQQKILLDTQKQLIEANETINRLKKINQLLENKTQHLEKNTLDDWMKQSSETQTEPTMQN